MIELAPPEDGGAGLRRSLDRLEEFSWVVFSSVPAVEHVLDALGDAGPLLERRIAAVGRVTAARLFREGLDVALVAEKETAEGLTESFPPASAGERVLIPQASAARPALADGLARRGYLVEAVEAYRTVHLPPTPEGAAAAARSDAVVIASPSAIEAFSEAYGTDLLPPVVVSIGPVTTRAAGRLGVHVDREARDASAAGIVAALVEVASSGTPRGKG